MSPPQRIYVSASKGWRRAIFLQTRVQILAQERYFWLASMFLLSPHYAHSLSLLPDLIPDKTSGFHPSYRSSPQIRGSQHWDNRSTGHFWCLPLPSPHSRESCLSLPTASLYSRTCLDPLALSLLLAAVDHLLLHALLALNIATPLHLAVAREGNQPALGVIASSTAHAITVAFPRAGPPSSSQGIFAGTTETGRVFHIHQVSRAGWSGVLGGMALSLWAGQLWVSHSIIGGAEDLDGIIVAQFQQSSNLMERWKLLPARPDSTWAGDTMALACGFETIFHSLMRKRSDSHYLPDHEPSSGWRQHLGLQTAWKYFSFNGIIPFYGGNSKNQNKTEEWLESWLVSQTVESLNEDKWLNTE